MMGCLVMFVLFFGLPSAAGLSSYILYGDAEQSAFAGLCCLFCTFVTMMVVAVGLSKERHK